MSNDPLTPVLYRLQDHRQRATYGAVAGVIGGIARSVMQGRERNPLHSWVVSTKSGLPTRYADDQMHRELLTHDHVIRDSDELQAFLDRTAQ